MFSSVLATMVSAIQTGLAAIGKKLNDYSSSSIIGVILAAIASVIDELNTSISIAQQQAYLKTATGTNLDNKAADFGITRKQATAAVWTFVATRQSPSTQINTIPAGAIITTIPSQGQSPITFSVNTSTQLPIGSTSVNIPVTCQQTGSVGNIAPGTQLLWGSAVPGIDGVQFNDNSTGTAGIDTETDDQLRARALAAFQGLSISTLAWYQSTALGVTGITAAKVVPQNRGPGTVDIYVVGESNTVPSTALINSVQQVIDAGRVITDDAKVLQPSPEAINVAMNVYATSGFDPTATAVQVQTAITNYINSLGVGGGVSGMLYLSQLQGIALSIQGVANAPAPSLPTSDMTFSSNQLPQAGTITITGH